ncbi:MAG: hypothetical protein ILO36_06630 [Abditibacteriota bacterium]|nr:hypothetical protein [Abditibacteriota bacterium]
MKKLYLLFAALAVLCAAAGLRAEAPARNLPSELNGVGTGASHRFLSSHILGIGIPLVYEFQAPDGDYVAVAGFCEPDWDRGGNRYMEFSVSSGQTVALDPAADPGKGRALFLQAKGRASGGRLRVEIRAAAGSPDKNTICSGIWIFDSGTWRQNSLSAETVARGEGDAFALYTVNCGEKDSDVVYRGHEETISRAAAFGKAAASLGIPFSAAELEAAYARKDFQAFSALYQKAAPLFERVEDAVFAKYSSFMRQSAETRIFSPGRANIEIRQEDRVKVSLRSYPEEGITEYGFHREWGGERMEDILALSFSGPGHDEGRQLSLRTDPALQDIDYTAARVKYVYRDATLSFNVCARPMLLITSSKKPFYVDTPLEEKNGVFRGRKGAMHFAVVSPEGRRTRSLALLWADSESKLDRLIASTGSLSERKAEAEAWAEDAVRSAVLRGAGAYDSLMKQNHRAMATMHWPEGQLLAALDGGYTHIWVRDTTVAVLFEALAGDHRYIGKWADFLINNYTETEAAGKSWKAFFTFPGKHYFKKEQDGCFYAAASCYGAWKLTGDASRLAERYEALRSASDYLDARWFDAEKGLYMETYVNEASMGAAEERESGGEYYGSLVIDGQYGEWIDSLYQNQIMYATHVMLAEMAAALKRPGDRVYHLAKARSLQEAVKKELWDGKRYYAGAVRLPDGTYRKADWFYHDIFFDYIWALTLFPALTDQHEGYLSLEAIMTEREPGALFGGTLNRNYFAGGWGHAAYAFAMAGEYEKARILMDRVSVPMRKVYFNKVMDAMYYMPDVMYENAHNPGNHKPQSFAIGPWMYAASAFCAIEDYNGVTAVPSGTGEAMENMSFRGASVTVRTGKTGQYAAGVRVNGRLLEGALKVPAKMLTGRTEIEIVYGNEPYPLPVLAYTNAEVGFVRNGAAGTAVSLTGFGRCIVRFDRKVDRDSLSLKTQNSGDAPFELWTEGGMTRMEYDASGETLFLTIKG